MPSVHPLRRRALESSSASLLAMLGLGSSACGSEVETAGATGRSGATGSTISTGSDSTTTGDTTTTGSGGASPDHPPTCEELATSASVSVSAVSGGTGVGGAGGAPGFDPPSPCTDPEPIVLGCLDTGVDRCAEGFLRRREAVACPTWHRPEATCSGHPGGCTSDAECGNGQICDFIPTAGPSPGFCECRGCRGDADCEAGQLCLCGDGAGECVWSSCRVDGDCASGLFCASFDEAYSPHCDSVDLGGFACQTAQDHCAVASECPDDGAGLGATCSVGANGVRSCGSVSCGVGRPLVIDGEVRVASETSRDDWRLACDPGASALDRATRERLASYWSAIGALEHASVASFARFAMELLALGAPPDLVTSAQRAMGDEIEHARFAYGLASAYGARPIGPGPLDVRGALGAADLVDFAVRTFAEGCIAEGVASLEAEECASLAVDPEVVAVYRRIAREEGDHAALAWSTLRWAVAEGGNEVAAALLGELAREEARLAGEAPDGPDDRAGLEVHGIVSQRHLAQLRRDFVAGVVRPVLGALLRVVPGATRANPEAATARAPSPSRSAS